MGHWEGLCSTVTQRPQVDRCSSMLNLCHLKYADETLVTVARNESLKTHAWASHYLSLQGTNITSARVVLARTSQVVLFNGKGVEKYRLPSSWKERRTGHGYLR